MSEQVGLLAGFSKVDITPDYPTGMGGYGNPEVREHQMVVDNIYTTCIALTDGDETILVYTVDLLGCNQPYSDRIRKAVATVTGIPEEKMFFSATHTHSAPFWSGYPNAERFNGDVVEACVRAAREALADRAPAKIMAAKKEIYGMNFVRHNITANGTYAGSNFGSFKDNPAVGYASEPDRMMVLVRFVREGLKKHITLVNWQGHPDNAHSAGFMNITSSYPGPLRDALGAYTGDLVAYFTGAEGNTNMSTRVEADRHGFNWREYGVKMASLIYEEYKNLKEVEGTGIATMRRMVEVEVDHSWDHMVAQADEVFNMWKTVGKAESDALGKTYGFTSSFQARAIRDRAKMGKTRKMEANAFRVGGVGFITATYEMFSEAGSYIKENSPYEFTAVLTGNTTYMPSDAAYNYRCYEADTGVYARGTSELMAKNYVEMLEEIK